MFGFAHIEKYNTLHILTIIAVPRDEGDLAPPSDLHLHSPLHPHLCCGGTREHAVSHFY